MKCKVKITELQAALLFSSDDESRYVLNSVAIEVRPKAMPVLVSMDGRRLCVIETDAVQVEEFAQEAVVVFNKAFLKPFCAFASKQSTFVTIEPHPPDRAVFQMANGCVVDMEKGALIDADYPKWRGVVPRGKREPISEIGFNSQFLSDFSKAAKLLGVDPLMRMNLLSANGATEVLIPGKRNFYSLVMPLVAEEEKEWQPRFVGLEKV